MKLKLNKNLTYLSDNTCFESHYEWHGLCLIFWNCLCVCECFKDAALYYGDPMVQIVSMSIWCGSSLWCAGCVPIPCVLCSVFLWMNGALGLSKIYCPLNGVWCRLKVHRLWPPQWWIRVVDFKWQVITFQWWLCVLQVGCAWPFFYDHLFPCYPLLRMPPIGDLLISKGVRQFKN